MKRAIMLFTAAALMAAMMVASAAPAMANDLFDDGGDHFGVLNDDDLLDNDLLDNDLFDNDRRELLDDEDDGGLFDGGGPICHDEDLRPELIVGIGFVCVEEDDLDDLHFDHHHDLLD